MSNELNVETSDNKRTFILGNCLRGCFEGEFSSPETAWKVLSARFLKSYPDPNGRHVLMWVRETNTFGMEDTVLCRQGTISELTIEDAAVMACRKSRLQVIPSSNGVKSDDFNA